MSEAPRIPSHEIQVHDRCLNCSAVLGIYLLPAVCDFGCTILNHPSVGSLDVALMCLTGYMERRSNGLIPIHVNTLCELACWSLQTRRMTTQQQYYVFQHVLLPAFSKLHFSKQNYAEATNFGQYLLRGHKYITHHDRSLVSHKYKNPDTLIVATHKDAFASLTPSDSVLYDLTWL